MRIFIAVLLVLVFVSLIGYVFFKRPTCKLCGAIGHSRDVKESIDRGTFMRQYSNFKIVTDSLKYIETNKSFFLERRFRYGQPNTLRTDISSDSLGYSYQFNFSPPEGMHLKTKHNIYCDCHFRDIPDTIRCAIWSYSMKGESTEEIGEAFIY